jgi:hypothetical protein
MSSRTTPRSTSTEVGVDDEGAGIPKRLHAGDRMAARGRRATPPVPPARAGGPPRLRRSAEGLRSSRPGERLLETTAERRVAIFGDSFAFSEEVPFEQSLNVHL